MTEHSARVSEAKVNIRMAVNISNHRTPTLLRENWKRPGPLNHPIHGHTPDHRLAGAFEHSLRSWVRFQELLLFPLYDRPDSGPVNLSHHDNPPKLTVLF